MWLHEIPSHSEIHIPATNQRSSLRQYRIFYVSQCATLDEAQGIQRASVGSVQYQSSCYITLKESFDRATIILVPVKQSVQVKQRTLSSIEDTSYSFHFSRKSYIYINDAENTQTCPLFSTNLVVRHQRYINWLWKRSAIFYGAE